VSPPIINLKNKLEIGDTSLSILRNKKTKIKELVIGYKTIYINVYNVLVMDITQLEKMMIFRHESF
jgi:hypothetical protein